MKKSIMVWIFLGAWVLLLVPPGWAQEDPAVQAAREIAKTQLRIPKEVDLKFIEKRQSSAFHDTDFHDRLQRVGVDRLVIAGMQTEYCVDSACRAAAALGYHVVLVSDGHTTFDSSALPAERIIAHHNGTLGGAFVELAAARDVKF
mgnify:CR=1 FL=1